MSKKITKLSHLFNQDSFLQINFIKGYKYIDKAGEIVNALHHENTPPSFNMNLDGLIIYKPTSDIETVKVSSNIFWMHFLSPGSLDQAEDNFLTYLKIVINILKIEKISRVGWRNHFMYDLNSESDAEKIIKKLSPIENLSFQEGLFSEKINKDIELKIRFKKIYKNDDSKTPALLFDIDAFITNKDGINEGQIKTKLSEIKNALKSDGLLNILNKFAD